MPLKMTQFRIERFKALSDATLHWHPRVNVLTGPNNSGKTTVLEALALWHEAFTMLTRQARQRNRSRGLERNDWYLANEERVHYHEVLSVRAPAFDDLFHRGADDLVLTPTFEDEEGAFAIGISIRKGRANQYTVKPTGDHQATGPRLNRSLTRWPHPFGLYFAAPVAAVRTFEERVLPVKVADTVRRRRSAEVFRNRIVRLAQTDPTAFGQFVDQASRILTGETGRLEMRVPGQDALHATVRARSTPRDSFRDVSLLGSGSLQILEVLLNLFLDPCDLDLVLLDEPDSHIHRDIQRRLLERIDEDAGHVQVFLTTHNEALIRSAGWDRVFHLHGGEDDAPVTFKPLTSTPPRTGRGRRPPGLLASPLRTALASVGAETALDLIGALEADHFLLVEGPADATLIDILLQQRPMGGRAASAMYWNLGGLDHGLMALPSLATLLRQIRNGRSLWDKAHLVLDRDLLTAEDAEAFRASLADRYDLTVSLWEARTAEATLLSGGVTPGLVALVDRLMTDLAPTLSTDASQVRAALETAWEALAQRLQREWSSPRAAAIQPQLVQRKRIAEQLELRGVLRDEPATLFDRTCSWHREQVAAEQLASTASKHDVSFFFSHALRTLGTPEDTVDAWHEGPAWFLDLCRRVPATPALPAWQTLRSRLERP